MNDYLEPQYAEAYKNWTSTQTPEGNAAMLKAVDPILNKAITAYVGKPDPLIRSRARGLALQGIRSYDPKRSRLQTHLFNQLQGLRRISRQQSQLIKVPERINLDRNRLDEIQKSLEAEFGREPTDAELTTHSGLTPKRLATIRGYKPALAEGQWLASQPAEEGEGASLPSSMMPGRQRVSMWRQLVYDDLPAPDQKIMEYAFGMNGRRPLSNQEIAAKMGRSPGLISQRKARIQALLDQEEALTPF